MYAYMFECYVFFYIFFIYNNINNNNNNISKQYYLKILSILELMRIYVFQNMLYQRFISKISLKYK